MSACVNMCASLHMCVCERGINETEDRKREEGGKRVVSMNEAEGKISLRSVYFTY